MVFVVNVELKEHEADLLHDVFVNAEGFYRELIMDEIGKKRPNKRKQKEYEAQIEDIRRLRDRIDYHTMAYTKKKERD